MTSDKVAPELKQVLGAMLFGSRQPVSAADLRRVMLEVAEIHGAEGKLFAKVAEPDIVAALDQLKTDLAERHVGVRLVEAAGGFRFQTDAECGPWLRRLLDIGKPTRLSRPALETLAIIAYRQPVTRAEIEGVRGVTVDTLVRNLLELQLIRIVGRSSLPGRPLLLGTTHLFLDHFGLKDLKELPGIEQLCRKEKEFKRRHRPLAADTSEGKADPGMEEDKETEAEGGTPEGKAIEADGETHGDNEIEDDGGTSGGKATKEDKGAEESGGLQGAKAPEEDTEADEEDDEEDDEGNEEDEDDDDDEEEDADEAENPAAKKG